MHMAGWEFQVFAPDIDEQILNGEAPDHYVRRLAEAKALTAAGRAAPGDLVLAADTTVALDGEILAKPSGAQEAGDMLLRLRGRVHQVYTGVAVVRAGEPRPFSEVIRTEVEMRSYDRQELLDYVASGDPLDKAGAYAIQNQKFHPVKQITGCYTNVVGLPLCSAARLLQLAGANLPNRIPSGCLETPAPIFCSLSLVP